MKKFFINIFVGFVKITGAIPAIIFLKPNVKKIIKKLPKPCIIVANHTSLLDFVLLLLVFPFRTVHFLMAEVLYNKGKFFAAFLNALGGIMVERDAKDFSFISDACQALEDKQTIGIFPQARLPIKDKTWPFTPSTAYIAINSEAPIVPVYIDGKYGISKRTGVVVGKPFFLQEMFLEEKDEQKMPNVEEPLNNNQNNDLFKIKLATAIRLAKDSAEEIKKAGYNVVLEELDTANDYQIIIKVQK